MIIFLKNNYTLEVDDFQFRCSIGKHGTVDDKIEGDLCTPRGIFKLERLFYRKDKVKLFKTNINSKIISKNMIWCNDVTSQHYNQLTKYSKKFTHEKMYRNDYKYDYVISLSYNRNVIKKNKGSAIFIHLTKNYSPTSGCIAIKKKDFTILLKLITKNTFIKIY